MEKISNLCYTDDEIERGSFSVKLHTKSKKIIPIKIQLAISPELKKRIIFYSSKLITEQIGSGGNYNEIENVISIIITDKTLVQDSANYHHRFTFYDNKAGTEFTDLVEINTLELNQQLRRRAIACMAGRGY